jgi:hypothetical protein
MTNGIHMLIGRHLDIGCNRFILDWIATSRMEMDSDGKFSLVLSQKTIALLVQSVMSGSVPH